MRENGRYANNQHELGAEISADPKQTSFYRALQEGRGTVTVLDRRAVTFSTGAPRTYSGVTS